VIGGAGLIDVELANPLDTFAGARGEESAREFGTLGYSIRARRSTWATAAHRMVIGRSSAKRMRPGKQSGTGARASTEPSSESSIHQRVGSRGQDASRGGRWHPSYRDRAAQAGMARAI